MIGGKLEIDLLTYLTIASRRIIGDYVKKTINNLDGNNIADAVDNIFIGVNTRIAVAA